MKSLFIVLIFIFSLLAANAAEISCSCSDNTISEYSQTGHDHSTPEQKATNDHCDHTCGQCHINAVIPPSNLFYSTFYSVTTVFFDIQKQPLKISLSLYRPPIS